MATAITTTSAHTARAIRFFNEAELFLGIAVGEPWPNETAPPNPSENPINLGWVANPVYTGASLGAANCTVGFSGVPFTLGLANYKVVALTANTYEVRKMPENVRVGPVSNLSGPDGNEGIVAGLSFKVTATTMTPGDSFAFRVDGPIGYKVIETKYLVIPDPAGTIDYRGQRWAIVSPSDAYRKGVKHVFVEAMIRYDELPVNIDYRQVGVFSNLVRAVGISTTKYNLLPAEVATTGALELVDNRPPLTRALNQKESFSFVIEF